MHDVMDVFFFFNDTATTEIYTLSLHDALPIFYRAGGMEVLNKALSEHKARRYLVDTVESTPGALMSLRDEQFLDRKSTRLNSSHGYISYAVFCLKKKNQHGCLIWTQTVLSLLQ